jgi:hypothetical protein
MGANVLTYLLNILFDTREKVGIEFRKYGANLIIASTSDKIDIGSSGVDFSSVTEQRYTTESD